MEVVDRPAASTDCQAMARSECRGQVGLGPSHRLDCGEPREQDRNGGGERAPGPVGVSSSYPGSGADGAIRSTMLAAEWLRVGNGQAEERGGTVRGSPLRPRS